MMHHQHPPQNAPDPSQMQGLACGLERIAGPSFTPRVWAPDPSGGGSGRGGTPRGVPLPGLQAARQRCGLSQAELAARSGMSEKTISRIERGGRAWYATLAGLARALRVSRNQLLSPPP
jgi:DNA-binding XRE family transcriptional regulator